MPKTSYRNYFLGSLTEEAVAEIDLRVLEETDFAAELVSAEEALIEDFLDNSLSTEEADLFRTNYLTTEERIRNVEMTALIKRYARESVIDPASDSELDGRENAGFFQWFGSLGMGIRLAAAAVALIVVIASAWLILSPPRDNSLIALQNRYEQINRDPRSLDLDTKLSELTLVSGNLRASGSTAELSRTELTENVRFRIALPPQTDNSISYDVSVLRDTTAVFRQNNIRPLADSAGPELRLLLPREIFTSGNYRLHLTGKNTAELNYDFVVR